MGIARPTVINAARRARDALGSARSNPGGHAARADGDLDLAAGYPPEHVYSAASGASSRERGRLVILRGGSGDRQSLLHDRHHPAALRAAGRSVQRRGAEGQTHSGVDGHLQRATLFSRNPGRGESCVRGFTHFEVINRGRLEVMDSHCDQRSAGNCVADHRLRCDGGGGKHIRPRDHGGGRFRNALSSKGRSDGGAKFAGGNGKGTACRHKGPVLHLQEEFSAVRNREVRRPELSSNKDEGRTTTAPRVPLTADRRVLGSGRAARGLVTPGGQPKARIQQASRKRSQGSDLGHVNPSKRRLGHPAVVPEISQGSGARIW